MSQAIIRRAFETRLLTWANAQSPSIPVAWEAVEFTPPATGARYVRAFLLPAPTEATTLARTDREYRGVFQVTLCMPPNKGAGAAETLITSLDAAFAHTFTQDGMRIWLLRPFSAAKGIPEDGRYVVPVSAPYRAQTYA
jgi:hypothetical protein